MVFEATNRGEPSIAKVKMVSLQGCNAPPGRTILQSNEGLEPPQAKGDG